MSLGSYSWFEVTANYFRIKFVSNLLIDTLIRDNFVLYDDQSTPTIQQDSFKPIVTDTDYDSISRTLTLWWDNYPTEDGEYTLHVNNLKNFLGESIDDFTITIDWITPEDATPGSDDLRPSHEPLEVEDYSIKTPSWSIIDTGSSSESSSFELIDTTPIASERYYLAVDANEGCIQLSFSDPVLMNYVSPLYFQLSRKYVKRGISQWESVESLLSVSDDSKTVSLFLPALEGVESATPIYSLDEPEGEITYFEEQYKYRLVISSSVASYG